MNKIFTGSLKKYKYLLIYHVVIFTDKFSHIYLYYIIMIMKILNNDDKILLVRIFF